MKSFEAKYNGQCGRCGDRFKAGAIVRYEGDVLVLDDEDHECEPMEDNDPEIGRKPDDVCSRCFLVHAGECF